MAAALVSRSSALAAAVAAGWLAAASLVVWVLEDVVGVPNASSAYLLAVVGTAVGAGTTAAVLASAGAFLLYDFLFTRPIHTLAVTNSEEWLTLLLLLFVGVVVGRLAASQRERADAAARREREAVAAFRISHTLALASSTREALPALAGIVAAESRFDRVWITLGADDATERVEADTGSGPPPGAAIASVLVRRPGDEPAEWIRVHAAGAGGAARAADRAGMYRVIIESGSSRLGSIRASRPAVAGRPSREETRLVSAAADQTARGLERDALARDAVSVEVARRSDALKTALVESVSHDLRTPLAAIRAAAGSLADAEVAWQADEIRAAAASIDRDAERLSSLVTNLLDLGRIEGGALRPEREPFVLADLVADAVERLSARMDGRDVEVDVPAELPPVLVDSLHVDQALTNILENAAVHSPRAAAIRVSARADEPGTVLVTIEDGGGGVRDDLLPRLFERFFRIAPARERSRRGTGIGLTVVRGLIESTGGSVAARRSELGGLAIDIRLPVASGDVDAESVMPGPAAAPESGSEPQAAGRAPHGTPPPVATGR